MPHWAAFFLARNTERPVVAETSRATPATSPDATPAARVALSLSIPRDDRGEEEFQLPPTTRFLKSCKARCAETGKQCTKLEHDPRHAHSASGVQFRKVLREGEAPRRPIDVFATQQGIAGEMTPCAVDPIARNREHQRKSRARKKALKGDKLFTEEQRKADRERMRRRREQDRVVEQLIANPLKGVQ